MEIKLKKLHNNRVIRIRSLAEVKEMNIKKDLQAPEKEKIEVCFKGNNSSGILEFTLNEAKHLVKELSSKTKNK